MKREFIENLTRCYIQYSEILKRFACQYVKDVHISEELVQDVYLKLLERKENLDLDNESIRSYLFTVTKNRTLDYLRRAKRENSKVKDFAFQRITINGGFYEDLESAYINGEVISTIHDVINELPEKKKEIFIKKMLLGMKITEISREMQVSSFIVNKVLREVASEIRARIQLIRE